MCTSRRPRRHERPSLAELRAAVKANPRDSAAWLQLAVALEQQHRVQAIEAARKAVEASPTAVSPRVALAVLSFDKDRPAASMGQLGPMLQQDEGNTEIRFHVGLLSLWVGPDDPGAGRVPAGAAGGPARPVRQAVAVVHRQARHVLLQRMTRLAAGVAIAFCLLIVPVLSGGRDAAPRSRAGGELHRAGPAGRGDQPLQRVARAERAQPTLTAPSYSLEYQPLSESMRTEVPVCGAWMKRPPPM